MVNFASPSQCQVTIESAVGGTTNPSPGNYTYPVGVNVTVTAVPNPGYIFDYWTDGSGHFMGEANPIMQTLYSNLTLQPLFENISSAKRVLTIKAAAHGTTNPPPGNYTYPYGANVTVTAIPDSGYVFDYWKGQNGNIMGGGNPNMMTMDYNMTLQPVFENASTAQRTLTILAGSNGTTNPPSGNYTYAYGDNVTVTAIPDSGYIFTQWIDPFGNVMGFQNPNKLTMTWNFTIRPVFENASTAQRTLTINAASGGTTNPTPGSYTYAYGVNVTVTAIPDPGYIFDVWKSGSWTMGNQNPNMLTMFQNMTIQPVFQNASTAQRTLTINAATGGTTDPSPGNYTYAYGTNVTVTAIADSGYVFDHWMMGSGGNSGNQNPWKLTMSWNYMIQPVFENATSGPRTLTIFSGSNGTTNPTPGTYTYNYGENVTVTAIPQNGTYFGGWFLDQASAGMNNPITITMYSSHTLMPNFVSKPPSTVEETISPATGGTTDPAPGTYAYPAGKQAKVTAIPDSGWWLDYWLLDGNNYGNSTTIELNLNGNHTVRPVFASNSHPTSFMLAINVASGGMTNPTPGTYTYNYGTNVTITATPNSGQSFEHWILDGQTVKQNPITLQMTQDHTLQPVFSSSQSSSGKGFSFNVPAMFILVPAMVIIACCFIGYLVPLGLAIRKGKVPPSAKTPLLILAFVSILIIVGPLGVTLLVYRGNMGGVLTPSNTNKLTNMLSTQGGIKMPNVTSSWCNLTSRTFCLVLNFTNPTEISLKLITCSANLTDHSDGYPLGQITLASPVTAGANETVTFQMTSTLTEGATEHIATAHAGATSFAVNISSVNINYAGITLQMNGTTTINNVSILR
jgi:hypothetical protein